MARKALCITLQREKMTAGVLVDDENGAKKALIVKLRIWPKLDGRSIYVLDVCPEISHPDIRHLINGALLAYQGYRLR